jgi:ABC-type polysaccharide/polyol phosphate export permease
MSIWLFLQSSAQKGCRSLLDRRGLIQNSNIEMSKFVKADILAEYLVFLVFFSAATILSAWAGILTWQMIILLPIFLIVLYFVSFGLGLIFATLTVFLRDLPYVVGIVFQVLFWLSPVAYPRLELSGPLRVVVDFNPLTYVIELGQAVVYSGMSRPAPLLIAVSVSIVFYITGNFVFTRLARKSVVTL